MPERPGDCDGIEDLLHRLNSVDAGAAWAAFIDRYSSLIMKVVRQFDYGQERDTECFLHVCEKLCERRFRRLQKFDPGGDAQFPNWLGTVVFNLCIDWHRAEFVRTTMLPAIAALPAFDQLVYRYCYEQGMSRESCYQAIEADYPGMTFDHIAASLGRIHALLTPRQRWRRSSGRSSNSFRHRSKIISGRPNHWRPSDPGGEFPARRLLSLPPFETCKEESNNENFNSD